MELLAEGGSILSGSEDDEIGVGPEELAPGENPLSWHRGVIRQAIASEVDLGPGIENLDPVRGFAIHVINRILVVGHNLIDHQLSGRGKAGQEEEDREKKEGTRRPDRVRFVGAGNHEVGSLTRMRNDPYSIPLP